MVQKCLDLAMELRCPVFMENPHSGLLKSRAVVMGIPYRIVDYCKYADERFPHRARKRTAIWTNTDWHPSRPLCEHDCGYCDGQKHKEHAQQRDSNNCLRHTKDELYAIPPVLVEDIFEYANSHSTLGTTSLGQSVE